MKIRGLFKKAAATLMAAVTALSILPATTAFAAGDIGTISFSHTYDSSGNAMRYNSSATFDGHTAGGTGNYKYRMFVDGENAFCIQPGVPLNTGNTLKKASSDTWNALSANQKKAVGLALLYGYQGNRSNLTGSDDEKWVATQTLVWEFVTGCREATGSFSKTSDKVYSLHFGSNYANSGAKAAYDQIVSLMSEHHTIPSFMSGSKNGITTVAIILCVIWSAVWLFVVLNENVYTMVTIPVWLALLGATILFLILTVCRILKNCNQYLEVSLDEIRT